MLRMSSEQLDIQSGPRDEFARSIALLRRTPCGRPLQIIKAGSDRDGYNFQYAAAAFLLWGGDLLRSW